MRDTIKTLVLLFVVVILTNCTKDTDSSTISTTTSTTVTTSDTEAIITLKDLEENIVEGYVVMMFEEEVDINQPLPIIKMQVVSNSDGIAKFDLNDYVTTSKTLYFEAFEIDGNAYVFKSLTHPEVTLKKGTSYSTTIYVE